MPAVKLTAVATWCGLVTVATFDPRVAEDGAVPPLATRTTTEANEREDGFVQDSEILLDELVVTFA